MEAFKNLHKEHEQLKISGLSTAEIRRVNKLHNSLFSRGFLHVSSTFVGFVDSVKATEARAGGHCSCLLSLLSVGKHKVLARV